MNKGFHILFIIAMGGIFPITGLAQTNVLGKPGQVFVPSAQWDTVRQVGVSFAYIPDNYVINGFAIGHQGPENIYGLRVPLTGFLEVNLNFTRKPKIPNEIGVGDRHIDIRVRLVKERKVFPSLVLVLTPPEGVSTFLSQDLIVATKNIPVGDLGKVQISGGYASPYFYQISQIYNNRRGFKKKTDTGNEYLNGFSDLFNGSHGTF